MLYEMDWITNTVASSSGLSTIRKLSEKYQDLKPNDRVILRLRPDIDAPPNMEEHLIVKSVITCDGITACEQFARDNHAFATHWTFLGTAETQYLKHILTNHYGDLSEQFLVITFM